MKIRLGLIYVATGTLLSVAVTACGDSDAAPPPSPTASPSPSAPNTTAAPVSPSEAATAAATSAIRDYFTLVDELRSDPSVTLGRLKSVATSAQLTAIETLIRRQRGEGQRQTGVTVIDELTAQSVNLENADPAAGNVPTVVIDVCWDVTNVDVLDESGDSILSPDRPDTGWTRYTVANYEYAADPAGGWRVATGQDLEKAPCAAA